MNSRTVVHTTALASCLFWSYSVGGPSPAQTPPQPELLYTLAGSGSATGSLAFSPDGHVLATGTDDGTIKLWDLSTGRLQRMLAGRGGAIGSLAFSPDGKRLATTRDNGTLGLWDVASGIPSGSLPGPLER